MCLRLGAVGLMPGLVFVDLPLRPRCRRSAKLATPRVNPATFFSLHRCVDVTWTQTTSCLQGRSAQASRSPGRCALATATAAAMSDGARSSSR